MHIPIPRFFGLLGNGYLEIRTGAGSPAVVMWGEHGAVLWHEQVMQPFPYTSYPASCTSLNVRLLLITLDGIAFSILRSCRLLRLLLSSCDLNELEPLCLTCEFLQSLGPRRSKFKVKNLAPYHRVMWHPYRVFPRAFSHDPPPTVARAISKPRLKVILQIACYHIFLPNPHKCYRTPLSSVLSCLQSNIFPCLIGAF